jgi:hypothetical protein
VAGASSQANNQDEEEANPDGQEGAIQAANQAPLASPLSESPPTGECEISNGAKPVTFLLGTDSA